MDRILTTSSAKATDEAWLDDFGDALAARDAARTAGLFADDGHCRDILAFTWNLRTTSSAAAIANRIVPALGRTTPRNRIDSCTPTIRVETVTLIDGLDR
jgi:hypothetical protein